MTDSRASLIQQSSVWKTASWRQSMAHFGSVGRRSMRDEREADHLLAMGAFYPKGPLVEIFKLLLFNPHEPKAFGTRTNLRTHTA